MNRRQEQVVVDCGERATGAGRQLTVVNGRLEVEVCYGIAASKTAGSACSMGRVVQ
jgi:hypothetical protein